MRHKLFKKQFGAIALVVFLSLSFILLILTFMYNSYIAKEKYNILQKSCEAVYQFIDSGSEQTDEGYNEQSLYFVMNNLARVSECDVFVLDQNGVIKICSCQEWKETQSCEHTGTPISIESVQSIAEDDRNVISTLGFYKSPHYTAAVKLNSDKGYVVAANSIADTKELMKRIAHIYVISAIIPLMLMYVAISIMTYRLVKPLRLMSEAAKSMAKGDFSKRIPVTRDDEIGQLAVSFNQMTNSLARLEDVRKSFIANVSHELKTPMTTIGGFIDGIIDGTIPYEKQNYYLNIVQEEVRRLSKMVEAMLGVSRLESKESELNYETFDFTNQVLQVVIGQERRIEQSRVEIIGLDTLPDVKIDADKDLIYRVVYNLVDNAVKFVNDGGQISFDISLDENNVEFKIKNTGKGIPQSELPHVFDRFYKVDKSRNKNKESTGLGLYIVKTIVKKHNGVVSVTSVENQFAEFCFVLPINRQE